MTKLLIHTAFDWFLEMLIRHLSKSTKCRVIPRKCSNEQTQSDGCHTVSPFELTQAPPLMYSTKASTDSWTIDFNTTTSCQHHTTWEYEYHHLWGVVSTSLVYNRYQPLHYLLQHWPATYHFGGGQGQRHLGCTRGAQSLHVLAITCIQYMGISSLSLYFSFHFKLVHLQVCITLLVIFLLFSHFHFLLLVKHW